MATPQPSPSAPTPPPSPAAPHSQHSIPTQPGHRVTVNPFPRRMSISRKMRKLEEKSSLAGRREGEGGSDRVAEEPKYLPWSPSFSPKIFRLSLPMPSVAYWPQ